MRNERKVRTSPGALQCVVFFLMFLTAALTPAAAQQQTTGTPGAPDATTTVDSRYLPPPPQKFQGEIGLDVAQSKTAWPARIVPPKGAPNILLILTDDVGFGAPSTFGGIIPTPAMDRIAASGLRYTNFHSTSLCSPSRAALITGRNHHSVGFGVISEIATGFPGYDSVIGKDSATIGRILLENGYKTAWEGKNHNTPVYQTSAAGPFDQWPTGMGFSHFYGFMGGDADQWAPGNLFRDTTHIEPFIGNPGWNLITAMADDAIQWMNELNDINPDMPFLLYYAPGGTHSPHHPTQEWVKKIGEMHLFDKGWNSVRDQIFANQKRLGVIPQDAKLTPWPTDMIKQWDQLTPVEQKLFIHQADIYGAYLAYTDHEIGRVIEEVEKEGKLDNTLIIYISGDNGSSAEGTPTGTPNEITGFNGVELTAEQQMPFYDAWGTPMTFPHYSVGWAWAFDTPYKWTKQIPSYFGGTRQGMAISWPAKITDKGGIRWQFHHFIDIAPTLLEVTGIPAPVMVDGIAQKPIEGVSMAYTFDKANANVPSRHHTQYFEMLSVQGLYNDGWMLSGDPIRAPWQLDVKAVTNPATAFKYELFDLSKDWTQYTDVAAANPEKVQEMKDLMFGEFAKYQVLPLDGTASARFIAPRPSQAAGRRIFNYSGSTVSIPGGNQPGLLNTSYTITADVDVPQGDANGVIASEGGRFFGWALYLLNGKPVYTYNLLDLKRTRLAGTEALTPGKHTIEYDFKYNGLGAGTLLYNNMSGVGQGGTGTLKVDGKVVSTGTLEHTLPMVKPLDDTFNIGSAGAAPVNDADYKVPFKFTGTINKVTIAVDEPVLTPEDIKKMEAASRAAQD
jgi:arylsulfatase A-like enzyme